MKWFGFMQVLANALPGFRDLRAPLVAGYIWLFFAWLIVDPNLDQRPAAELPGSVYDLIHQIGPIWTGIAVGVLAYLIGSVSQVCSRWISSLWREFELSRVSSRSFAIRIDDELESRYGRTLDFLRAAMLKGELGSNVGRELERMLEIRRDEAKYEANRELELPATLLVGDQSELFAEVDRLRAEGELRISAVPPLVALTGLLVISGSFWWLLLLPAILALFLQGIQRDLDAKKSIADAMRIGRIQSSSIDKFTQWADNVFPQEVKRLTDASSSRG